MVGARHVGAFNLDRASVRMPLLDADGGRAVLRIPGVAEYLVGSDGSVRVARTPGTTDGDVGCFANGPVSALGLLLSGRFPLRAAAVATAAGGVVLCGPSAAGKSATAAALALRGHIVLADKVVAISPPPGLAVTGTPADVELWPSMARELGLDPADGEIVRPALAKRAFGLGPTPGPEPVRASLVVLLAIDNRLARPELVELADGRQKLHALLAVQWHRRLIAPLGFGTSHLDWSSAVAATVRFARLSRPRHGMTIGRVAELIENVLDGAAPRGSP